MDRGDRILTLEEASRLLRVSRQTLSDSIRSGRLTARKVGREYRILQSEVLKFLRGEASVSSHRGSIAILGTETLNSIEDFFLRGSTPTHQTLFEFEQFASAIICHDDVYVLTDKEETEDLEILEAFSSFIHSRSFHELTKGALPFRKNLEQQLAVVLGKDHPIVYPEVIISKGISARDRSAGALQEHINRLIRETDKDQLPTEVRRVLLKWQTDPSESFSVDLNYYLRTFLYNALTISHSWSFLPNFCRAPLLTIFNVQPAASSFLNLMKSLQPQLVDLVEAWRRDSYLLLRSPIALVCLDQTRTPEHIPNVLLSLRDHFTSIRERFSELEIQISNSGTIGDIYGAVTEFEREMTLSFRQLDWSSDLVWEKHTKQLISRFLETLRLSFGVSLKGLSANLSGQLPVSEVVNEAKVAARLLPLVRFYRDLANSQVAQDVLKRLYNRSEPLIDQHTPAALRVLELMCPVGTENDRYN